ncbi:MAG: lysine 2,3-aminomutase, partial [Hamadaea sp.]|nr:lysine 2,3-aminomutase [Hamadaea sp.]
AEGGFIQRRAHQVLDEAVELLEVIEKKGLLTAIGEGTFGIMKRPADRGKGLDGVAKHEDGYYNPATELLEAAQ